MMIFTICVFWILAAYLLLLSHFCRTYLLCSFSFFYSLAYFFRTYLPTLPLLFPLLSLSPFSLSLSLFFLLSLFYSTCSPHFFYSTPLLLFLPVPLLLSSLSFSHSLSSSPLSHSLCSPLFSHFPLFSTAFSCSLTLSHLSDDCVLSVVLCVSDVCVIDVPKARREWW